MAIFALEKLEAVSGRQDFHILKKNGISEFEAFESEVKGTQDYSDFKKILSLMSYVANLGTLPHTKFKDITPNKETVKEYEFKSGRMRVYVFHQPPHGKLVVCAGFKSRQDSDIKHFRNLKREYLDSLIG